MSSRKGFRVRHVGKALPPFRAEFVDTEALSGIVLLAAAVAALVWANTATVGYFRFWHHHLDLSIGGIDLDLSRAHWVTDGLMTLFFFVVGLEIKREVVRGELRDLRATTLPVVAAIGGMALPAALYLFVNSGGPGASGWAIPTATDIAFAVGVLALLGDRVPHSLKLFLLTLAIVDDIGAILIIAVFYSDGVRFAWLAGAAVVVVLIVLLQRLGVGSPAAYLLPAFALWLCFDQSGVHATIAGVVLGLLTPARPIGGKLVIEGVERRLHPFSSFVVVPLFALANAGIPIDNGAISRAVHSPITLGIVVALVVGKTVGISTATLVGARLRIGRLPTGVGFRQVVGIAAVAGIGFTVALFVAELSYEGPRFQNAVLGILAGSILSGAVGSALLASRRRAAWPSVREVPS